MLKLQLDMLQEENEVIREKVLFPLSPDVNFIMVPMPYYYLWFVIFALESAIQLRLAEERRQEGEARCRELEKQVKYLNHYAFYLHSCMTIIKKS